MLSLLLALIYICFISLGLPDSLLGSAWPVLHQTIGVDISYAGIISAVISIGTILSSLFSDRLVRWLGSGRITAISIGMTAAALFGFSTCNSFIAIVLWAVPYGLGAGGVDAVLNNYVALHYKAQHMSWLHCFWGVGAAISPYIMSFALTRLNSWSKGYLIVSIIQTVLSVIIFISIPLWKKATVAENKDGEERKNKPLKISEILSIKGAAACMLTFFGYCGLEISCSLWVSTYLVLNRGIDTETASSLASLFYIGLTVGRAINGFLAMRFSDRTLIRVGFAVVGVAVALILIPVSPVLAMAGFIISGFGCAPIYPCIIHMTPDVFGKDKSQAMIGIQMAFAYIGFCLMPPLFGLVEKYVSIALLPVFLLVMLLFTAVMHEIMVSQTKHKA